MKFLDAFLLKMYIVMLHLRILRCLPKNKFLLKRDDSLETKLQCLETIWNSNDFKQKIRHLKNCILPMNIVSIIIERGLTAVDQNISTERRTSIVSTGVKDAGNI